VPALLTLACKKLREHAAAARLTNLLDIAQYIYNNADVAALAAAKAAAVADGPREGTAAEAPAAVAAARVADDIRDVIFGVAFGRASEILSAPSAAVPRLERAPVLAVRMLRSLYECGRQWGTFKCPKCRESFEAVIPTNKTCSCLFCGYRLGHGTLEHNWARYKVHGAFS
jgi:hypothetical protein